MNAILLSSGLYMGVGVGGSLIILMAGTKCRVSSGCGSLELTLPCNQLVFESGEVNATV